MCIKHCSLSLVLLSFLRCLTMLLLPDCAASSGLIGTLQKFVPKPFVCLAIVDLNAHGFQSLQNAVHGHCLCASSSPRLRATGLYHYNLLMPPLLWLCYCCCCFVFDKRCNNKHWINLWVEQIGRHVSRILIGSDVLCVSQIRKLHAMQRGVCLYAYAGWHACGARII